MPWPDQPLHPDDPDRVSDPNEWPDRDDTQAWLMSLGKGDIVQLNSQRPSRAKRKYTTGFAPQDGRPEDRPKPRKRKPPTTRRR